MDWKEWLGIILRGMGSGGYVRPEDRKLPGSGLPATKPATDDQLFGEKGKRAPEDFKQKIRGQAEQVRKATGAGGVGQDMWDRIKDDMAHVWPWLIIGVMILIGITGTLREAPNVIVSLTKKGKGN